MAGNPPVGGSERGDELPLNAKLEFLDNEEAKDQISEILLGGQEQAQAELDMQVDVDERGRVLTREAADEIVRKLEAAAVGAEDKLEDQGSGGVSASSDTSGVGDGKEQETRRERETRMGREVLAQADAAQMQTLRAAGGVARRAAPAVAAGIDPFITGIEREIQIATGIAEVGTLGVVSKDITAPLARAGFAEKLKASEDASSFLRGIARQLGQVGIMPRDVEGMDTLVRQRVEISKNISMAEAQMMEMFRKYEDTPAEGLVKGFVSGLTSHLGGE